MVFKLGLTLTDFEEATFGGENAKNFGFCAEMAINSRRVYHAGVNHVFPVGILTRAMNDTAPRRAPAAPPLPAPASKLHGAKVAWGREELFKNFEAPSAAEAGSEYRI